MGRFTALYFTPVLPAYGATLLKCQGIIKVLISAFNTILKAKIIRETKIFSFIKRPLKTVVCVLTPR